MRGETEQRPAIGTKLYFVQEHWYRIPDHAGPLMEYSVCEGEVSGYFTKSFTEIRLVGKNPDGFVQPAYHKLSELGQTVFFKPREAAELARRMTEKYERIWSWTGDPPMRRTWARLLEEQDHDKTS